VDVTNTPTLSVNSGAICSESSLTLTANGATNYTWSPTTDLSSATGSVVVANPNATTIYSVLGANGSCTAVATSTVDVTTTPTLSVNSGSICSGSSLTLTANGALNYTWSPTNNLSSSTGIVVVANPNSTTIYSVIGANGSCTATANSTVNINLNPTITVNSSTICAGQRTATLTANGALTYSWVPSTNLNAATGSLVTGTPNTTENYTVSGVDANGCFGSATATINLNSIPNITVNSSTICVGQQTATLTANGASTYSWTPSTNLSAATGSLVTGTPASTENYTIAGTDVNGCIGGTTSTITVNPLPVMTITPNMTVCPLAAATLTAGGASTYTWSPSLNLSSVNGSAVIASPISTTTYTVIGATNTCTNSAEVVVTITANPTLSIVSSPSIICSGNLSTLSASGATTYTWSPAATLSSANGSNVNANPITTTVYSVSGTNAFGCLSSTTATLSVVSTPTISAIANPLSICAGQTSTLSAFGASNYTWSPSITITNPNSSSTIATPALSTIYNVIGSTGTASFLCTSSNTVQVTILPVPTITVSPQIVICEGQSSTIYAVGANTNTWSPTIGLTNPYAASTNLSPNGSGTFIYTVTAVNINCAATETVEVIVNPLPIINAGSDTTINIDNSLVLFGTGNTNVGFLSTDGTQLSCNYCYSLTVNPQNNTCYTLEGINNFGCRTTDDICVTVTKDWDVFIPNAFTPNGDKNNEFFIPVGYGITEMRLTIFDRWGHLVFKSNGETIGWDGKKNGQLCEQGVYIYQAEVLSISGTNLKKSGHVTLLSRVK
jgi:gliding motility-associated-like protein